MKKVEKSILTAEWLEIKAMYEANTNGSSQYGTNFPIDGELDKRSMDFIDKIGALTQQLGFDCVVDGVKMDLWKERIWSLVENAGLLPEIAWKDERDAEEAEVKDDWYETDNEMDLDELAKQEYGF